MQHIVRIGWIVVLLILILLVLAPKAGGHHDAMANAGTSTAPTAISNEMADR